MLLKENCYWPTLRIFSGKLSKWELCKSCKLPYKPFYFLCLVKPIHTNSYVVGVVVVVALNNTVRVTLKNSKFYKKCIISALANQKLTCDHTLPPSYFFSSPFEINPPDRRLPRNLKTELLENDDTNPKWPVIYCCVFTFFCRSISIGNVIKLEIRASCSV